MLKRIAMVFCSIAVMLIAMEILFRIFNLYPPPGPGLPHELTAYGWRTVPNLSGLKRDLHGEFSVEIRSNSFGMREDDVEIGAKPGVRRIAFFGDSYTEAHQVEQSNNFVERVERILNEKYGLNVQTLNFGTAGYGPDLCYRRYLAQGRAFSPDIVVLMDTLEGDAHDVTLEAYPRWMKPSYDVDRDTWLEAESPPAGPRDSLSDPRDSRWYRKSHLYTLKRAAKVRLRAKLHDMFGRVGKQPLPIHWQMFDTTPSPYWERAWRTSERLMELFHGEVERDGHRFVAVLIPSRFEIHAEDWESVKQRHIVGDSIDLTLSRRRMLDITRRLNVETLDLYSRLLNEGKANRLYLKRDGHLNVAGHEVVADEIARYIAEHP